MTPEQLKRRTKTFALRVIRVFKAMPRNEEARTLCKQMLRSGTSNYRAVCRSRSKAEFLARLGVLVEETDETVLWLELLAESEIFPRERLTDTSEANELLAIVVSSQLTAKGITSKFIDS